MNLIINIFLAALLIVLIALPVIRSTKYMKITPDIREKVSGRFIHLSHGYTHYDIGGPEYGKVVILIHGFSVPYYMWDQTFTALVKAGFRVIRYDLYGRGLSDRPKVIYNRNLFVTQLAELLDALSLKEPVHLVGNSMGGAIAAAFTASYPEKVEKLVLIAPFFEKWNIRLLKIPFIGEYLIRSFLMPAWPQKQLQDFYQPEYFPEWPVRFREQMRYQGFSQALLSTLRYYISEDPTPDFEKVSWLKKKVLLIWGAEDQTLKPHGAIKLYKILKPDFLWIEKTGHLPQYESSEIVNQSLQNFFVETSNQDWSPKPVPLTDLPQNRLEIYQSFNMAKH